MKATITKKEKAIEILKKMDIYKPYIKGFEEDKVCFFEQFGGFWIDQEPEVHAKMKALEEKHKCKVYAVTHEYTESESFTTSLSLQTIPKSGTISYTAKEISIRLLPTSGTKTTIIAPNSAALPYRVSVAESEGLREVTQNEQ